MFYRILGKLIPEAIWKQRNMTGCISIKIFNLSEIKLMIDGIQASQRLNEKYSTTLIDKLKKLYSHYETRTQERGVIVVNCVKTMNHSIHYIFLELLFCIGKICSFFPHCLQT